MNRLTRSPHSWLRWWAHSCPWERILASPGLEILGAIPQRRPPSLPDRTCDWITVSILLTRLTAADRWAILKLITGMADRLPRNTERRLNRELRRRKMV